MFEEENVFEKIVEILGNSPENFVVLEEQIDVNLHMEFFEYAKKYKVERSIEEWIIESEKLFSPDTSVEDKKILLNQLSGIGKVETYRIVEKFVKTPDEPLKSWAVLSLQNSRMLLESTLLDENQVFISTGLGGKGNKLRYFVVLVSKTEEAFNETQQRIIRNEFDFAFQNADSEMEIMQFVEYFCTMIVLIPMRASIRDIFGLAVGECNELGDFISQHFLVTNVKAFETEEVKKLLKENSEEKDQQMEIKPIE